MILRIFFRYCVKSDILVKSPLLAVELPKIPKEPERNTALSDTDIKKLIDVCDDDIKHFPFVFAAFTGLRVGELLALTNKDVDLKNSMINIDKSVSYYVVDGVYQSVLSSTKTEASIRRVPILDEIQELLRIYMKSITKVTPFNGEFLLFPSSLGEYRNSNSFRRMYQILCDKLGIEKGRTIHSLRHTFCTILARQGVSLLEASRLMGHSNVNITAKIYSHVSDNDKKNAVQKLSVYFN